VGWIWVAGCWVVHGWSVVRDELAGLVMVDGAALYGGGKGL
jgi:hypothetical protein